MDKLSDEKLEELKSAISFMGLANGRIIHESGEIKLTDLREMASELLQLREQVRWIPVSERLPDDGDSVLVYFGNVASAFLRDDGWWRSAPIPSRIYSTVTHWQPLPPAPEVE